MRLTMTLASLLALSIGCNGTVDDGPDDPVEPSPYILDEEREGGTEVDLGAVSAELQGTLDTLWTLNAQPVLDAYADVAASQTAVCPRTYAMDGNVYWFDQCTTDDGTSFSGYGFYYTYEAYPLGDNWFGDYALINGAARVETPRNTALDLAGSASIISAAHAAQPANLYRSEVRGSFGWDGAGAAGTWLDSDLTPDLSLQMYERTDVGGSMIQVDGGVSGMDGEATAIVFDGVTVIQATLGGTCEQEAYGTISLRTADGTWVDLVFDGPSPETFQSDPAECDGKGRAYFRGDDLGEVTADFSVLIPDGAPW